MSISVVHLKLSFELRLIYFALYSKLTQLEKEHTTRLERLRWAEGFIRTMQFMMDKGYNDYTNSILVQMEYLTAMKWYAENSPALLDCLQSEIDAVRMRFEMRNVVWEKIKKQMVDLGNPTDYRS